jgi:hypothetical protein
MSCNVMLPLPATQWTVTSLQLRHCQSTTTVTTITTPKLLYHCVALLYYLDNHNRLQQSNSQRVSWHAAWRKGLAMAEGTIRDDI